METDPHPSPSFSPYRKWAIGLHVLLLITVVLSVLVMVNYLSRDYFLRFHLSTHSKIELAPRTVGLLRSLTNQVKVTLYYDTSDDESLYSTVADLLSEYRLINPRITVQTVDSLRDAGLAQRVKDKYNLSALTDKNLVIFDCEDRWKIVDGNALAHYIYEQVANETPGEKNPKFLRKPAAFLGEMAFTQPCSTLPVRKSSRPISFRATASTKSTAATNWPVISSSLPFSIRIISSLSPFRCSAPMRCRWTAICW